MKTIRITITNADCEVLDSTLLQIPDDHKTVGIRTFNTSICPVNMDAELEIGIGRPNED